MTKRHRKSKLAIVDKDIGHGGCISFRRNYKKNNETALIVSMGKSFESAAMARNEFGESTMHLKKDHTQTASEYLTRGFQRLHQFIWPRRARILDAKPRTPSGGIRKRPSPSRRTSGSLRSRLARQLTDAAKLYDIVIESRAGVQAANAGIAGTAAEFAGEYAGGDSKLREALDERQSALHQCDGSWLSLHNANAALEELLTAVLEEPESSFVEGSRDATLRFCAASKILRTRPQGRARLRRKQHELREARRSRLHDKVGCWHSAMQHINRLQNEERDLTAQLQDLAEREVEERPAHQYAKAQIDVFYQQHVSRLIKWLEMSPELGHQQRDKRRANRSADGMTALERYNVTQAELENYFPRPVEELDDEQIARRQQAKQEYEAAMTELAQALDAYGAFRNYLIHAEQSHKFLQQGRTMEEFTHLWITGKIAAYQRLRAAERAFKPLWDAYMALGGPILDVATQIRPEMVIDVDMGMTPFPHHPGDGTIGSASRECIEEQVSYSRERRNDWVSRGPSNVGSDVEHSLLSEVFSLPASTIKAGYSVFGADYVSYSEWKTRRLRQYQEACEKLRIEFAKV